MWVGAIIILMMWVFAVMTTRMIGHKADLLWADDEETAQLVRTWFGTILSSMYTLFKVFTLNEWVPLCDTVMQRIIWFPFFMIGYILLSSYTMASLVTAVISENMIAAVVEDESKRLHNVVAEHHAVIHSLASIFLLLDTEKTGIVSLDACKRKLSSDKHIIKRLEILDI